MRRKPQWVLDACEGALAYELDKLNALPDHNPEKWEEVFMPLHSGSPYMRTKDVIKFYWPTL